jgi:hypothetical protein
MYKPLYTKNLIYYLTIFFIVIISYFGIERPLYKASWRVHIFAILFPILILMYVKKLNLYVSLFIYTLLIWHLVDVSVELIGMK